MKNQTLLFAIGSAMALSACGGGGGGGSTTSGSVPVQTSTLSPITAANSSRVASNAYAATISLGTSASSLTGLLTGASVSSGGIGAVGPVLALLKHGKGAAPLLAGVTTSNACSGGGTVSVDATLRDERTLSNGDVLTYTTKNCSEDGYVLDGVITITFSSVTNAYLNYTSFNIDSPFDLTIDIRFTNFTIAAASDKLGLSGDMKIALNHTNVNSNALSVSGKSLQTTTQNGGASLGSRTLADYTVTASTIGATTTNAASFSMSGSSAALGQFAYTVKNVQPFVSTGSATASNGALIVNGAASSVTTTAVGNGVRLDFSAKGDGTITQTNTLGWTEFLASF